MSPEECKKKWSGLRDTRRQIKKKKETETRSGSGSSKPIRWGYYELMSFLDNCSERRKTITNKRESASQDSVDLDFPEQSETKDFPASVSTPLSVSPETAKTVTMGRRKSTAASVDEAILKFLQSRDEDR